MIVIKSCLNNRLKLAHCFRYAAGVLDKPLMRQHDLSNSTSTWNSGSINHKYKETYTYDGNGNIRSLIRYGANAQPMDRLAYNYNFNGSGNLINNKLASLKDTVDGVNYPGELDEQSNYTYDAIGNLIGDSKENITSIDWTVYGKIKTITSNGQNISYTYDPGGNRVSKTSGGITTWYVRDAQGNQLGVYDNNGGVFWREQQLYGSSRLGMWRPDTTLVTGAGVVAWSKIGRKSYELSNHLGNVLAVVSDKYAVVGNDPVAELLSAQDYYPFGMIQPGRSLSSANYRYGFNGKENDNEVKGTANQQDYGMRIYDPRVGRFLSVDPIANQYPWYTPYQFAGNMPIKYIDLDGLEPAKNPNPDGKQYSAASTVGTIGVGSSLNNLSKNGVTFGKKLMGNSTGKSTNQYVTDTDPKSSELLNMKVSKGTSFNVDESNAAGFKDYEAFVVNEMMQGFLSGKGPENYNFPTNGIISSKFLKSDILNKAMVKYNAGETVENRQFSFGGKELLSDLVNNQTPYSITGFTGTASITIKETSDGIAVKIFNITGLSSGALIKIPSEASTFPKSYVRDPKEITPFGNISQTYNLLLPKKE
jgi:RHS repeat-associated protein